MGSGHRKSDFGIQGDPVSVETAVMSPVVNHFLFTQLDLKLYLCSHRFLHFVQEQTSRETDLAGCLELGHFQRQQEIPPGATTGTVPAVPLPTCLSLQGSEQDTAGWEPRTAS